MVIIDTPTDQLVLYNIKLDELSVSIKTMIEHMYKYTNKVQEVSLIVVECSGFLCVSIDILAMNQW